MQLTGTGVAIFLATALLVLVGIIVVQAEPSPEVCGLVVDAGTHRSIEGAWVVSGEEAARTNRQGRFTLRGKGKSVGVRAIGYSREQLASGRDMWIALRRLAVRGLYLSFWGVGRQCC